jgi:hypothetical protein
MKNERRGPASQDHPSAHIFCLNGSLFLAVCNVELRVSTAPQTATIPLSSSDLGVGMIAAFSAK